MQFSGDGARAAGNQIGGACGNGQLSGINSRLDETRLRSRGASRVFLDEAAAARGLRRLIRSTGIMINDIRQQWMRRLAQADRTLAILRIERAAQNDGRSSLLTNAARDLAKGDEARDRGDFAKAIVHYFQAWKPADRFMHYLETHE